MQELQRKYKSKVEQGSGCDLKDLTMMREDNIGSALIPKEEVGEEMKALNATADGNCLFNSASISLVGDESASHMLRLLTAVELFLNPQYYANHPKLTETKTFSTFSDTTLLLSDSGKEEFEKEGSRTDASQAEAMAACKLGKWGTFLDVMAVANVLKRPLFSLDLGFRHGKKGMLGFGADGASVNLGKRQRCGSYFEKRNLSPD